MNGRAVNGWHPLPVQLADWAGGASGVPAGCAVVPGPNGNELCVDDAGRTRAVRPLGPVRVRSARVRVVAVSA